MLSPQTLRALVKASSYDGMQQHSFYQYAPIGKRRELSKKEQGDVQENERRWFPEIFQSYATRPVDMLASPGKQSLLHGLGGAAVGGLVGGLAGNAFDRASGSRTGAGIGAGIGGLGAGGLAALLAYFNQQAANRDIVEQMRRLPEGATKRDMMSDPIYQKDQDRQLAAMAAMAGGRGFGSSVGAGIGEGFASSMF